MAIIVLDFAAGVLLQLIIANFRKNRRRDNRYPAKWVKIPTS